MELNWGAREFTIVLDLVFRYIWVYAQEVAEGFHTQYGGKRYYTSRTGLSGAGWVPDRAELAEAHGFRVDTRTPWVSFGDLMGHQIGVPYDAARDWPVLWKRDDASTAAIGRYDLFNLLAGREPKLEERSFTERFIPAPGTEPQELMATLWVSREAPRQHLRHVAQALNLDQLQFNWTEQVQPRRENPFWGRLAMVEATDSRVYSFTRGRICRASYDRATLDTVDGLQAAAGPRVRVLTPLFYVQGRKARYGSGEEYTAVGLFRIGETEYDFELMLPPAEFVRALQGDFADILARLREGAEEKARVDRENRETRARWEAEEAAKQQSLAERVTAYGDAIVTFADSLAAGNCEPGTRDFRDRVFPGREEVKLAELLPYIGNGQVRRLVEWKLRQIA